MIQLRRPPVLQGSISELGLNQLLQQAQSQAGATGQGGTQSGTGHQGLERAERPRQPMALSEDQRALLQLLIAGEHL